MAARIAAARFASSRRTSGQGERAAWVPLALRWRRKRKRLATVPGVRSAAPAAASVTWLAQFHLHFSALATHRVEREVREHSATRDSLRSLVSRNSTTVRTSISATRLHSTARVFRTISAAASKIVVSASAAPPGATLPEAVSIVHHTDRRMRSLVESVRRVTASKNEHTHVIERRSTLVSHQSRVFRRSSSSTHVHSHRETTTVPQTWFRKSPELAWRTAPRRQTESGDVTHAPVVFPRPVAVHETAAEPARSVTRAALQAADFDPGLLDRLTDDVIRRVERRARIERERRGL